jgi:hypothetical protein
MPERRVPFAARRRSSQMRNMMARLRFMQPVS